MRGSEYTYCQDEVAERVKMIREERHMTQAEFAQMIGYSKDAISKLERCVRGISGHMTAMISLQTGVSCDYILFGKTQSDIAPDARKKIMSLLRSALTHLSS